MSAAIIIAVALTALRLVPAPAAALASTGQLAMLQPGSDLLANPSGTLNRLRSLGVGVVRVTVTWSSIAPHARSRARPSGFNAADPGAYPARNWTPWDAIVSDATALGIRVDLTVGGGAPLWADGVGIPSNAANPQYAWKPSSSEYGKFVRAVGTRYGGQYVPAGASQPLPRVDFWALWNEPNFGKNLAPQATNGSALSSSPGMYRSLLDAGWQGLQASGHGHDTILIGSLAARGSNAPPSRVPPDGLPGKFGTTKPLQFIRTLYCVGSRNQQLRGAAASAVGCPTSAAGSRGFRKAHPALFGATGFADHPYPLNLAPPQLDSQDPDYTELSRLPRLETLLDRVQRAYASSTRFPIYVTEYGYITNPPNRSNYVSPATAAYYMNWAEYLFWRSPRVATTMQYPLSDPTPNGGPEFGGFASGLLFSNGTPKPGYAAYRLPLYMPVTSGRRGASLEVWGCARPAHLATGAQQVEVQFQPSSRSPFNTIKTVTIASVRGYFDVHVSFPGSGSVRLQWTYPDGTVAHSRLVKLTER